MSWMKMKSEEETIYIRPLHLMDDSAFIYSSWCNGLYFSSVLPMQITRKEFFQEQSKFIKGLLEKADIQIVCLSDDPDTILGYSVILGECLEWIFVKESFRRTGIAKFLLKNKEIKYVNQMTRLGKKLNEKYKWGMKNGTNQAEANGNQSTPRAPESH